MICMYSFPIIMREYKSKYTEYCNLNMNYNIWFTNNIFKKEFTLFYDRLGLKKIIKNNLLVLLDKTNGQIFQA